jgi:hypothetical protein
MVCTVAGNIEIVPLEMITWPWIRDTYYIYSEDSRFVYVAYRGMLIRFFPHSNATWRHDKVVRHRKSRATSRQSFIIPSQCGDTTSCVRHLESDRQLSLISKENERNVR